MRMSSIEEYGLRCLLRIARNPGPDPVSIPQIAEAEGLSPEYAAKLLRILREADLVTSTRGASGGYRLARPADEIAVGHVLTALDGPIFPTSWCDTHTGKLGACVHSTDCSVAALWRIVGLSLDGVLSRITLADLLGGTSKMVAALAQAPLEGGR